MTTALRRMQVGLESTRGTLVAANKRWAGALQYSDVREAHMPEDEERNSLALLHRRTELAKHTELSLTAAATYQALPDFLSMAIKGAITPTTPTNGVKTRLWTILPSLTASNAQDSFTVEYGDDQQEYECGHVMAEQLEFAGSMGEALQMTVGMFGQGTAKATFTGGLTKFYEQTSSGAGLTLEDISLQDFKIYVDSTWAGLGTTQKTAVLAGLSVRIPTGLTMIRYADGSKDFSTFGEQKRGAEVELTLRHNADGEAQYDNYVAGTLIFVRLIATGSEIEAVTPTYDNQFTMDFAMRYTEAPQFFSDYNGHNTVVLTGRTFHDPTSDNDMNFVVQNEVSSLTAT